MTDYLYRVDIAVVRFTDGAVKHQARRLVLREFLEQYVRHGMRINDPLPERQLRRRAAGSGVS